MIAALLHSWRLETFLNSSKLYVQDLQVGIVSVPLGFVLGFSDVPGINAELPDRTGLLLALDLISKQNDEHFHVVSHLPAVPLRRDLAISPSSSNTRTER